MELVLMSYPRFFEGEAELVTELMNKFPLVFHLRKPEASFGEYRSFLECLPAKHHKNVMLHGEYELAELFGVKGLHFSTRKRELAKQFKNYLKSTSAHSVEEAKNLDGAFEYIFLSPVFPSISKKGYTGNLKMQEVIRFLDEPRESRILALGGLNAARVPGVRVMGFEGMAFLGSVWGDVPDKYSLVMERMDRIARQFLLDTK